MAKSATAQVNLSATVTYSNTDALGVIYTGKPVVSYTKSLANSVDITKVYSAQNTSASPVVLDLTNCTDSFGATLTFATLKGLYIQNTSGTATLVVGGGSNSALGGDQYTVGPGQAIFVTTPWTIAGSSKNVVVTPGASLTYQLVAVGS